MIHWFFLIVFITLVLAFICTTCIFLSEKIGEKRFIHRHVESYKLLHTSRLVTLVMSLPIFRIMSTVSYPEGPIRQVISEENEEPLELLQPTVIQIPYYTSVNHNDPLICDHV